MVSKYIHVLYIAIQVFGFTMGLSSCSKCGKGNSLENRQYIQWASEMSEESLDIILTEYKPFVFSDGRPFVITQDDFCALSSEEIKTAMVLLYDYFYNYEYEKDITHKWNPFPLRRYFRQYIGYTRRNSVLVYINLYTHAPYKKEPNTTSIIMDNPYKTIINEENGGNHFGTMIIDITEKKVINFSLNSSVEKSANQETHQ